MGREDTVVHLPEVSSRGEIVLLVLVVRKILLKLGDAPQGGFVLVLNSVFIVHRDVDGLEVFHLDELEVMRAYVLLPYQHVFHESDRAVAELWQIEFAYS